MLKEKKKKNLIEEGKKIGISEVIKYNEIINNSFKTINMVLTYI